LNELERESLEAASEKFHHTFNWLASESHKQGVMLFKQNPKHHMPSPFTFPKSLVGEQLFKCVVCQTNIVLTSLLRTEHMVYDMAPQMNPRAVHCYCDEDSVKHAKCLAVLR
jgi:hypothetical protein